MLLDILQFMNDYNISTSLPMPMTCGRRSQCLVIEPIANGPTFYMGKEPRVVVTFQVQEVYATKYVGTIMRQKVCGKDTKPNYGVEN